MNWLTFPIDFKRKWFKNWKSSFCFYCLLHFYYFWQISVVSCIHWILEFLCSMNYKNSNIQVCFAFILSFMFKSSYQQILFWKYGARYIFFTLVANFQPNLTEMKTKLSLYNSLTVKNRNIHFRKKNREVGYLKYSFLHTKEVKRSNSRFHIHNK